MAIALNNLGEVAACQGNYEEAKSLFEEALRIRRTLGDKRGIAYSLAGLAEVHLNHSEAWNAVVLWGAADALRETIGSHLPAVEQEKQNAHWEKARSVLGSDAFAASYDQGRKLTWEQAVGLALRETNQAAKK